MVNDGEKNVYEGRWYLRVRSHGVS